MRFLSFLFILFAITGYSQNVTIHKSERKLNVVDSKNAEIQENYTITVHNEDGYRMAVYHDYFDKFRKIRSLSMIVKDKTGKKVKKLGKGDAIDFAFNASYETVDTRQIILDPDYKSYPFSVEVESRIELKGFIGLPTWMPVRSYEVEVEAASFTLQRPASMKIDILEENVDQPSERKYIHEGSEMVSTTWAATNVEETERDIAYKVFYDMQPKVYLSPQNFELDGYAGNMSSWENFGDWFLEVNQDRDDISLKTKEYLASLDASNVREFVGEVYSHMQAKTRYVSIQLGIGGFQSLPASLVDEKGYGDCKALTTYMKSMLDYKGINSNYILVRAGSDVPDVKKEFPSNQFNHVFLGIPTEQDTILIECTSQASPVDYIGTFTDDRNVLWVEKGGSKIIRTPTYSEDDNKIIKEATVFIDEEGNGVVNLKSKSSGVYYGEASAYQSFNDTEKDKFNYRKFDYRDFSISKFSFEEKKEETELNCDFELQVNGLAKSASSKILVPVNMLQSLDSYVKTNKYTRFCEIKRGFTIEEKVNVKVPENFWSQRLPSGKEIENEYGFYSIAIEANGEKLVVSRKLVLKKGRYSEEEFDSLNSFFNEIKRADRTRLVFESKT